MASLIPATLSLHSRLTLLTLTLTQTPRPLLRFKATRAMSSESTQRAFQLRLDPLTGNSEWIVIEEQEQEEQISNNSQKPLLATTSYLDMLNDSPRNKAFRQAIDKTVTQPCHVIDIGAGTGLLSMMAARAMCNGDSSTTCRRSSGSSSTEGMVTACESYLPMVKLMRKVARLNGMERKIKVFNKRSDELQVGVDIPSRADILVSEILDSELLGEGLIPSLQHAHDMLLVENPQTVPYRATTYGQLSEPFKIFEFDFWKRPDSHREIELHIKATNDGRVNAVVSWWILQLDCEGTIFYSTAPRWISSAMNTSAGHWCDHWKQCVWFVPGKGMSVSKDEEVYLHAVHTETSIFYNLKTDVPRKSGFDTGDPQLILSPERIAIYGDREWRQSMFQALRNALQERVNSLCIVADDSVFLTLLVAHLSKTSHVISLFPGLRDKGAQYLQAVADANGFSMDRVEVLEKRKTCLTMHDTHQKKVDLLIGEPFYYGNEGMLPWQNLRFWKERSLLDSVLSKDVLVMPCKGLLKACAMSLPNLWKSRRCLSNIEGFDHSVVNTTLGACGELPAPEEGPCLPFYIWQCGEIKELSEIFTVMEFDFSKPIKPCYGKAQVEFTEPGICHGFALWIDWVMDSDNSIVLSTGPDKRYWKQGVKLLANPVAVGIHESRKTVEHISTVEFTEPGICHGFALWIDWVMDSDNSIVLSTGPDKRYWKQGVKLLANPVAVGIHKSRKTVEHISTVIEASFDPSNGELIIRNNFI
nr:protein arginine n-methyltransferase 1.6 [Quercus suber]